MTVFNQHLAQKMYGAKTERELRDAIHGERSGITEAELRCITGLLDRFDDPVYCEVGVYFGGTFRLVMDHISSKPGHLGIGIDLFEDLKDHIGPEQTHEALNKWNILNVAYRDELEASLRAKGLQSFHLLKGMSHQVLRYLPWLIKDSDHESVDPHVIFLDGNHTYDQTMRDFEAAHDAVRSGGYIVFHNASNNIAPDPEYVARDGGPWQVCEDIAERVNGSATLTELDQVERCRVFRVDK